MEESGLVRGRQRRSTAGNRMATLLAGQLELEEAFMEVENDEEFVGKDGRLLRALFCCHYQQR